MPLKRHIIDAGTSVNSLKKYTVHDCLVLDKSAKPNILSRIPAGFNYLELKSITSNQLKHIPPHIQRLGFGEAIKDHHLLDFPGTTCELKLLHGASRNTVMSVKDLYNIKTIIVDLNTDIELVNKVKSKRPDIEIVISIENNIDHIDDKLAQFGTSSVELTLDTTVEIAQKLKNNHAVKHIYLPTVASIEVKAAFSGSPMVIPVAQGQTLLNAKLEKQSSGIDKDQIEGSTKRMSTRLKKSVKRNYSEITKKPKNTEKKNRTIPREPSDKFEAMLFNVRPYLRWQPLYEKCNLDNNGSNPRPTKMKKFM